MTTSRTPNTDPVNLEQDLSASQAAEMLRNTSNLMGGYAASLRELKIVDGLSRSPDAFSFLTTVAQNDDQMLQEIGKQVIGFYLDASENARDLTEAARRFEESDGGARFNNRALSATRRYEDTARFMYSGQMMDFNLFLDYNDPEHNQRYLALINHQPADELARNIASIAASEQARAVFWSLQITGFEDNNTLQKGLIDIESDELQDYIAHTFGVKNG